MSAPQPVSSCPVPMPAPSLLAGCACLTSSMLGITSFPCAAIIDETPSVDVRASEHRCSGKEVADSSFCSETKVVCAEEVPLGTKHSMYVFRPALASHSASFVLLLEWLPLWADGSGLSMTLVARARKIVLDPREAAKSSVYSEGKDRSPVVFDLFLSASRLKVTLRPWLFAPPCGRPETAKPCFTSAS